MSGNTLFNKVFFEVKPMYQKVATVIPSNSKSENYKWLGKTPRMKEWIGERAIQNLTSHSYTIKNKDFELTISIERNDIEDDHLGTFKHLVQAIALSAAEHPDELIFELLINGFENPCYDNAAFFSDMHPMGTKGIQSNKGIYKLSPSAYGDARGAMRSIKDDHGKPLKINPDLLVVSPQNESMGKLILNAKEINGSANIYKDTAELLVIPELSSTPELWFLLDTSKAIRPLIYQERKKPEFVAKYEEENDNIFFEKEYLYGTDSRGNAGYGLWQLAFGSTGEEERPAVEL